MDPNAAGLVGAAIGAGALLLAQLVSNRHQRQAARDDWLRNKLAEIYEGALATLTGNDWQARDRWLSLLLIYFPPSNSDELRAFADKVQRGAVQQSDIIQLALSDSRLGRQRLHPSKAALLAPRDPEG